MVDSGVWAVWREEARGRSKLVMIGRLMDYECQAQCVGLTVRGRKYVGEVERRDSRIEN